MPREGPVIKGRETYKKAKKKLETIHRSGIVHRDVREENILYTSVVYIINFAFTKDKINTYDSGLKQDDFDKLKGMFLSFAWSERMEGFASTIGVNKRIYAQKMSSDVYLSLGF